MSLLDNARQGKTNVRADFTFGTRDDVPETGHEGILLEKFYTPRQYNVDKLGETQENWRLQQDDNTTVVVWGGRKILAEEMSKANPNVGDRCAVYYQGPRKTKKGYTAHPYRVLSEPANGTQAPSAPSQPAQQTTSEAVPF